MQLSVIVPMAPAENIPEPLLASLAGHGDSVQIILARTDPPSYRPGEPLCEVRSAPGRGRQQNAAAAVAKGRWLWFVHADSALPVSALEQVLAFASGQDALGYCRLRFASDGPILASLNAFGANLRSRWLDLPYGDQGLCLPSSWFRRLGGFRQDLHRGEDLDLVVRARRAGLPLRCMGPTLTTSARRYRQHGWLRTTLQHQVSAVRLIYQARKSQQLP